MRDCVVYGVEIPGTEGRAGMAAIPDPERRVDLPGLYAGMVDKLPSYARPIFLRFVEEIDVTSMSPWDNPILEFDYHPTNFRYIQVEEERLTTGRVQT